MSTDLRKRGPQRTCLEAKNKPHRFPGVCGASRPGVVLCRPCGLQDQRTDARSGHRDGDGRCEGRATAFHNVAAAPSASPFTPSPGHAGRIPRSRRAAGRSAPPGVHGRAASTLRRGMGVCGLLHLKKQQGLPPQLGPAGAQPDGHGGGGARPRSGEIPGGNRARRQPVEAGHLVDNVACGRAARAPGH